MLASLPARLTGTLLGLVLMGCGGVPPAAVPPPHERPTPNPSALHPAPQSFTELVALPSTEWPAAVRTLAAQGTGGPLRRLALAQLAYLHQPEGVGHAIQALTSNAAEDRAHAARVLAYYGPGFAGQTRAPLRAALAQSDDSATADIVWALVALGDRSVAKRAIALYREDGFPNTLGLDGQPAFDHLVLGSILEDHVEELRKPGADARTQELAAFALASRAAAADVQALAELTRDPRMAMSQLGCVGLFRSPLASAGKALLARFREGPWEFRSACLSAVRHRLGGPALVNVLGTSVGDREQDFRLTQMVFDELAIGRQGTSGLDDPDALDGIFAYVAPDTHVHFRTCAGFALARLGDLRAVPLLAERLRMDPLRVYGDDTDAEMELKRDDSERVIAARYLADLATLHPRSHQMLRAQAEDALIAWLHDMPSPHSNGMRALATMGSTKDLRALRDWAHPDIPLPKEGQQPPMPEEWVISLVAQRYVGVLRDPASWPVLLASLHARPREVDVTMESLLKGGLAMLGMSLRARGVGAADGLSEWGDPRGFDPLFEYIQDPRENEQSRQSACQALPWVGTPAQMQRVFDRVIREPGSNKEAQFIQACLLEGLTGRSLPMATSTLLSLLLAPPENQDAAVPLQAARALGRTSLSEQTEERLLAALRTPLPPRTLEAITVALLLGGSQSGAVRVALVLSGEYQPVQGLTPEAWEAAMEVYHRSLGVISQEDLQNGTLFRWVENAAAFDLVGGALRPPPRRPLKYLTEALSSFSFDRGPHSMTRSVLRTMLFGMAKNGPLATRRQAIQTLGALQEEGVLAALGRGKDTTAWLARRAALSLRGPSLPPTPYQLGPS